LDAQDGAAHDRPRPTGAVAGMALLLGMQPGPRLHGDGAVLVVLADQGGGRGGPAGRVGAVELGTVAAGPADLAGWRRWRVGVEAAVRSQPHQHRHPLLGQVEGELGGVVAGVEDEQRHWPAGGQPAKQHTDLRSGGLVGVVQGMQPLGIDRGGPGVPREAQPRDPLERPAGDDRLASRVPRGMVVVAAAGRALGIAARPGGHVHREHRLVSVGQAGDQQVAEPVDVDAPAGQRGIGAAPAAPVGRLQAELGHRGDRRGAQQRVAQLKQRIGAAAKAGVQLGPERAEPCEGESWRQHGRAA
jgi:hypothetical protein